MEGLTRSRTSAWLERAWLERYLARQLEPLEIECFEVHALDKPGIIEQIELDTLLKRGLSELSSALGAGSSAGPLRIQAADVGMADNVLPLNRRRVVRTSRWLGAAAMLGLAMTFGWLLPKPEPVHAPLIAAPQRVVYDAARGGALIPHITTGGDPRSEVYIADIAVPSAYRILAMTAEHRGQSYRIPIVDASDEGFVTLVLPVAWRAAATLQVDVVPGTGDAVLRSVSVQL